MKALQEHLDLQREKLERLLDLHLEAGIESREYAVKKNKIVDECVVIEEKIKKIQVGGNSWFEPVAKSLKVSNEAFHSIQEKNYVRMGKILKNVGSNPILRDKSLSLGWIWLWWRDCWLLFQFENP